MHQPRPNLTDVHSTAACLGDPLVSIAAIEQATDLTAATIYTEWREANHERQVAEQEGRPAFTPAPPTPIRLSAKQVRYRASDVRRWIDERVAAALRNAELAGSPVRLPSAHRRKRDGAASPGVGR